MRFQVLANLAHLLSFSSKFVVLFLASSKYLFINLFAYIIHHFSIATCDAHKMICHRIYHSHSELRMVCLSYFIVHTPHTSPCDAPIHDNMNCLFIILSFTLQVHVMLPHMNQLLTSVGLT